MCHTCRGGSGSGFPVSPAPSLKQNLFLKSVKGSKLCDFVSHSNAYMVHNSMNEMLMMVMDHHIIVYKYVFLNIIRGLQHLFD